MHTSFKKSALAAAITASLIALPQASYATAYAVSTATVTNFSAFVPGGTFPSFGNNPATSGSGFAFSSSNTASLDGVVVQNDDSDDGGPFSVDRGISVGVGGNGPVDPLQAFVGAGGPNPGENQFAPVGSASPSYARADHVLTDTLVNRGDAGTPGTGLIGGDWQGVAESAVQGNLVTGAAISGNTQTWEFGTATLTNTFTARFAFDISLFLQALQTIDEPGSPLSTATANYGLTVQFETIDDAAFGGVGFTFERSIGLSATANNAGQIQTRSQNNIGGLGISNTASTYGVGFRHIEFDIAFDDQAGDFDTNRVFQFSIVKTHEARVTSNVPEPASLGLMGAGLLALGAAAARRRRNASSAAA